MLLLVNRVVLVEQVLTLGPLGHQQHLQEVADIMAVAVAVVENSLVHLDAMVAVMEPTQVVQQPAEQQILVLVVEENTVPHQETVVLELSLLDI
jgi:hypothetical protein